MKWLILFFLGDSVKVDESLFEEIDDLDIGDAGSSDESWTFFFRIYAQNSNCKYKILKKKLLWSVMKYIIIIIY